MKIIVTLSLTLVGLGFLFEGNALSHGVGYREAAEAPVALEFFYSTGEPMSYREARVFSPADEKFAHQTGRTDAAGRFAFVPDAPGTWRVIVKDEEGHQAAAEMNVTRVMLNDVGTKSGEKSVLPVASNNPPEGFELLIRAVLGVSLLFNFAVIPFLRRRGHAHQ